LEKMLIENIVLTFHEMENNFSTETLKLVGPRLNLFSI
jgi:hypothetical protein